MTRSHVTPFALNPPVKQHAVTVARITLGIGFLILGIIGALVPVMQGWIFILLAALMFFPSHPLAERTLRRVEPKMPRLVAWLRRIGVGQVRSG